MIHYFAQKTWPELAEYIKQEAVVILPVGTTEEHGRHLPVGTDAMIARGFGDLLGEECDKIGVPALVMETIQFGFSMAVVRQWPGCPNINPRVFEDYVFNVVDSLVTMGFKKIVMLDCHGNHDWELVKSEGRDVGEFRYLVNDYRCRRCGITSVEEQRI